MSFSHLCSHCPSDSVQSHSTCWKQDFRSGIYGSDRYKVLYAHMVQQPWPQITFIHTREWFTEIWFLPAVIIIGAVFHQTGWSSSMWTALDVTVVLCPLYGRPGQGLHVPLCLIYLIIIYLRFIFHCTRCSAARTHCCLIFCLSLLLMLLSCDLMWPQSNTKLFEQLTPVQQTLASKLLSWTHNKSLNRLYCHNAFRLSTETLGWTGATHWRLFPSCI